MHTIIISKKKDATNLNESGEKHMGGFEESKEKREILQSRCQK